VPPQVAVPRIDGWLKAIITLPRKVNMAFSQKKSLATQPGVALRLPLLFIHKYLE
jgi:hypothetical protein